MKRINLFAASVMAAAALVGCNKNEAPAAGEQQGKSVSITVGVGGGTKAIGITDNDPAGEGKVNDLQVFVFQKDNGQRDGYNKAAASSVEVECTIGEREIYAVVNCPDWEDAVTKAELLAKVSEFSRNTLTNFQMIGSKVETLTTSSAVTIDVNRFAGRVVVKNIENALTGSYADKDFNIDAIYLINVPGKMLLDLSDATTPIMYNQHKFETGTMDALVYDAVNANIKTAGTKHETAHYFYSYPHLNPEGSEADHLRLVIEATLDGTKTYYPINIKGDDGKFLSNKSYEINNVKITRLGSTDPNKPVEKATLTFSINVVNWTPVAMGDVEI